jgi:hypothetical protein
LRIRDLRGGRGPILEIAEDGHQDDGDYDPEDQIFCHVIQVHAPR